jgi:hypothetical protein
MRAAIAASAVLGNLIPKAPSFLLAWPSMVYCAADLYRFHRDDSLPLRYALRRRKPDFCRAVRRSQGIYPLRKS